MESVPPTWISTYFSFVYLVGNNPQGYVDQSKTDKA